MSHDWDIVYREENVDIAYSKFIYIFKLLYKKNCPVKVVNRSSNYNNHPWLTKGLRNACKKNFFYINFILINIYYRKMINDNKNNLKGVWDILHIKQVKERWGKENDTWNILLINKVIIMIETR